MRHGRALSLLVSAFVVPLTAASAADASKTIAPPGNSGVGQYVEVVPGAGGSTPVGAHSSHGPVLSSAQRHRLEAAGPSGKALASYVQQTGVARSKTGSSRGGHGRTGASGGTSAAGGASPTGSGRPPGASSPLPAAVPARSTRAAGGGLGWGLPAALGAIALAAIAFAVARRRVV